MNITCGTSLTGCGPLLKGNTQQLVKKCFQIAEETARNSKLTNFFFSSKIACCKRHCTDAALNSLIKQKEVCVSLTRQPLSRSPAGLSK